METHSKKSFLENFRVDLLDYCLDFLESHEIFLLRQIKNKFLLKIVKHKKLSESLINTFNYEIKNREHQTFDFPPKCNQIEHKKIQAIFYYCKSCSKFICDSCSLSELKKYTNKKLLSFICKNRHGHKGSLKYIDPNCEECQSTLCANCVGKKGHLGKIVKHDDLKKFCEIKENQKIQELHKLYMGYLNFFDQIDSFIEKTHGSHRKKFDKEFKKFPDHKLDLQKLKTFVTNLIKSKLEQLSVLIVLKIYRNDSLEKVDLKFDDFENILLNKMKIDTKSYVEENKIKILKFGEKLTISIDDHQYAEFTKLSLEKMMEKLKLIPNQGIETYGLATYSEKIPCHSCHQECPISGFWHHDDKSRYSIDYICSNCQCSVYYNYDWSGPWD
jgi:hypothetical protein